LTNNDISFILDQV